MRMFHFVEMIVFIASMKGPSRRRGNNQYTPPDPSMVGLNEGPLQKEGQFRLERHWASSGCGLNEGPLQKEGQ
ncbi:Hypothetical protein PFR_JS17-2_1961 [Propionibacterium freudenreichii]|nr:Hypothetical protein PFR_JS17-1_1962 [Propionibacterium freudenreichii]SCQ81045.1 Hypothetical protein PFR_JS17-2_1961 [Propionibacterium freudenreichii]